MVSLCNPQIKGVCIEFLDGNVNELDQQRPVCSPSSQTQNMVLSISIKETDA